METTRNTRQKQAVYAAVCALDHPTATEVFLRVRKSNPTVSRGTVFRVLSGFARSGSLRRICLTDSDVRYDVTLAPHAHARCRSCGAVRDVFLPELETLSQRARADGFTIEACETEFFGICDACAAAQSGDFES